jgi:lipid II:glycine glycyltransferase (peptidoglycan interpeptide bridge formation enzyme)
MLRGVGPFQWAYAPRGPVPATIEAVSELVEWAHSRRLAMLRVEPEGPPDLGDVLGARGFRRGELSEPRHTLIVTLDDDERLLASFHAGTRHKIRKAARSGVVIEESTDIDELARQIEITYRRHNVRMNAGLARALYHHLPASRIYVARYGGEILAAILIVEHGRRAYYLAGGSSGLRRELMPNHLLQWRAMGDAYRDGCVDYDLVGMPPPNEPNHPWHGLYQFKSGFGGTEVEYAGSWDLRLSTAACAVMRGSARLRTRATNWSYRIRSIMEVTR